MCKYSTLLTPSPSRESPTLQQPYWYRSSVTESLTSPMRTLPSEYGAGVGLISVEPPSLSQRGGATTELVIAGSWFVGEIIDNSESSFMDSINHHFRRSRWSLVQAVSCKHFPSREALLCAILARAHTTYSSILAAWVRVTPTHFVMKQSWYVTHMSLLHQPLALPRSSPCHSPHHPSAHLNQGPSLIHTWPFTSTTTRTWNPHSLSGRRVMTIKLIFSHLVTISCPLISHNPSPFHIEPLLFSIFHLPFTPTLSYQPDPPCIHPDSSNHRHTIRITIFCSYTSS